jgi:hypothetical protein
VTDESTFELKTKGLEAEQVWSKSVSYKGQFIHEVLKVYGTYVPSYCRRVPDSSHFDLPPKALEAEQL